MMKRMALFFAVIFLLAPAQAENISGEWFDSVGCLRVAFPQTAAGQWMDVELSLPQGGAVLTQRVTLPTAETAADLPLYDMAFTWTRGEADTDALFSNYEAGDDPAMPMAVFLKAGTLGAAIVSLNVGGYSLSEPLSALASAKAYRPLGTREEIGTFVPRVNGNVRSEPSAGSERVGMARALEEYPCFERTQSGWLKIELPGTVRGYISGNLGELLKLSTLLDARALREQGRVAPAAESYDELMYPLAAQTLRQWDALRRGDNFLDQGDYVAARQQYLNAGALGDAPAKAQALEGALPYPDHAVLFLSEEDEGSCDIVIKAAGKQHARYIKILDAKGSPIARVFLRPGTEASVAVRPGNYRISHAAGTVWYGEDKAFGASGLYARLPQALELGGPDLRMTVTLASREKTNVDTQEIAWRDF